MRKTSLLTFYSIDLPLNSRERSSFMELECTKQGDRLIGLFIALIIHIRYILDIYWEATDIRQTTYYLVTKY